MNCTRAKRRPVTAANERAISVLARPGLSSISTCPSASRPSSTSSSTRRACPRPRARPRRGSVPHGRRGPAASRRSQRLQAVEHRLAARAAAMPGARSSGGCGRSGRTSSHACGPEQATSLVAVEPARRAGPDRASAISEHQRPQLRVRRKAALARPLDDPLDPEQLARPRPARWSGRGAERRAARGQPRRERRDADHRRDHADDDDGGLEQSPAPTRTSPIGNHERRYPSGTLGCGGRVG